MTAGKPKRDTIKPCLLCGWAEHMAVHQPVQIGPRAGLPSDHAYVSENVVRHRFDKPAEDAPLFEQAAWFLADYAELWYEMGPHEGPEEMMECGKRCLEMLNLAKRLRTLAGEWEEKSAQGTAANAAAIIADMLSTWRLPGTVWWLPPHCRWRVTGSTYRPREGEVCVGVYAPGVDVAALTEDLEAVQTRPLVAAAGELLQ